MYVQIEKPLQDAIWNKWLETPLSEEETAQVFQIDDEILAHEFLVLMETPLVDPTPKLRSQPEFAFMGFEGCEQEFLRLFRLLTGSGAEV